MTALPILLVEDNPAGVLLVRTVLENQGLQEFQVREAVCHCAALPILQSEEIEAILLDLSLADCEVKDTFDKFQEEFPDIPIIVMASNEEQDLAMSMVQKGADSYFVKGEVDGPILARILCYAIDRKRHEKALLDAREEAFRAVRAQSEFLATMSHEIRTPLNAILGMADMLQETQLNPEQSKYIRLVAKAGESLKSLINDILDISRIEAGGVQIEKTAFDLHDLIESTSELYSLRAHKKGIHLEFDIDPDIPFALIGDPLRLRQVVTNLISNAVKFTEDGTVKLRVTKCDGEDRKGNYLFSVSDSGIGIPENKLEKIFNKFTQAEMGITRKYGGTGLGLAICKGLVEKMGGEIWVESREGKGSDFYFTVTLDSQAIQQSKEKSIKLDLDGWKALIIEKNATERRIVRDILTSWGAQVEEAQDGEEGLTMVMAAMQSKPYDLILLDLRMQPQNGFEVASMIPVESGVRGRTLIMLPSNHRFDDLKKCAQLGLGGFVIKPIQRSTLRSSLEVIFKDVQDSKRNNEEIQNPLHILFAEDSEDNQILLETYFKDTPHTLDCAENGKIALEKFKAGQYDLVLMDMAMPEMDGYTATREIRKWEKEQNRERTPVLALTASVLQEDAHKSLKAGCDAHLTKPIKKQTLLDAVTMYSSPSSQESTPEKTRIHADPEIADLIPGFLKNREGDVQALLEALGQSDFETIRRLGHNMKGSGKGYGFDQISEIGKLLEDSAKQTDPQNAKFQVEKLAQYLESIEVVYDN